MHHPRVAAIELAHNEAAGPCRLADAVSMEGREEILREHSEDVAQEGVTDDDR